MSSLACLRCYVSCKRKPVVPQFKGQNNSSHKEGETGTFPVQRPKPPFLQTRALGASLGLTRSSSACPGARWAQAEVRSACCPGRGAGPRRGRRGIAAENEIIGPRFQAVRALYF